MEYQVVINEFIKSFVPNNPMLEKEGEKTITRKRKTEEERNVCEKAVQKLQELVLPSTVHFQRKMDQEAEKNCHINDAKN